VENDVVLTLLHSQKYVEFGGVRVYITAQESKELKKCAPPGTRQTNWSQMLLFIFATVQVSRSWVSTTRLV
jgi:hypothetical protein